MTPSRHFSFAMRSSALMTAGFGLIAAPFVIGLGTAALVTGVAIGTVMVALALAGTEASGRGTIPVSAQAEYDRGLALGLLLVGVVFGVAEGIEPALLFGAAGLAALIVAAVTRYTARPA
jgi:hypothetical protein